MSKNGMHLEKMGKFKCVFSENASVRYVYSLCGEGGATLYTESGDWEHFLTYKSVMFFRKVVPHDAVRIERKFKKGQLGLERNWLNARLSEGLYLVGKVENEYIFARSNEYRTYEYQLRTPSAPKKYGKKAVDPADTLKDIKGLKFVTVSADGSCYYFLKDARIKNRFAELRGRRFSDLLLSATLTFLSLVGFIAFSALAVYGAIKASALFTALGASGIAISLISFIAFFKKTQKITEARRILLEEERARREAEAEKPQEAEQPKPEPAANNTVVMNTVVLNKYGEGTKKAPNGQMQYDTGFDCMGQLFDQTDNPALDPSVNPAIAAAKDPLKLANSFSESAFETKADDTVYYTDEVSSANKDAIYDGAFTKAPKKRKEKPVPKANPVYDDEDDEDPEEYEEYEEYDEYDDGYESSLLPYYILYGLATVIGALLIGLGAYFLVSFFTASNGLFAALAIISFVFAPFLIKFGVTNFRYLSEEPFDDEDEMIDDEEDL